MPPPAGPAGDEALSSEQRAAVERCLAAGQGGALRFWERLDAAGRRRLADDLAAVDFGLLKRLVAQHVTGRSRAAGPAIAELGPAPVVRLPRTDAERTEEKRLRAVGLAALRAGRVAVITVAGGQGTRLGFDGPKGCYPLGPVTARTLFRHHAEKVLALSRRAGRPVPWLVMTSPANFWTVSEYLSAERFFGLDAGTVHIFRQGMMPAVDRAGELIVQAPDRLAMSPNGHGGTVAALADSGLIGRLRGAGVDTLFYFQVDNPLVAVADPSFVGRHIETGSEMSLKVVAKRGPGEKVGVVMDRAGRLEVIEYSDLPEDLARATAPDGSLLHWAGSIAIHVFALDFLARLATEGAGLPYHRADKKVPCVDDSGRTVEPAAPNGVKFESFIFDALPVARKSLVVECAREREFAPVKNATGEDSAESSRLMLTAEWARWIEQAGGGVPRRAGGSVDGRIEVSPLYALDEEELAERLPKGFQMKPGQDAVLGA